MTDTNDAMGFLMTAGSKIPTAKFLTKGTTHKGRVLAMEKKQQTIYGTTKPAFWDNGDPKWQIVFTLQTEERDESNDEDDGRRRIFAKGKILDAIKEAVEESGWRGATLVGGNLAVRYTADGQAEPGMNPPHHFAAKFEPPAAVDDLNEYDDDTEPF